MDDAQLRALLDRIELVARASIHSKVILPLPVVVLSLGLTLGVIVGQDQLAARVAWAVVILVLTLMFWEVVAPLAEGV